MSEFDLDDLLTDAVSDYRDATLSQIKPAGSLAAHATAIHRRRVHMISMGVLAAVLVITPISAYAAIDHNHNGPPTVAASQTVTPTVKPSTATPSTLPSTTPSTPASTAPATATLAPITEHELANSTLNFGTGWGAPCPRGNVKMDNGQYVTKSPNNIASDKQYGLIKVVTADVDHDGSGDAIGLFGCDEGDPGRQRVIAFDRTAGGAIHTMGDLASGIDMMRDIAANSNGTIRVQVSNLGGSDGFAATAQVVQWRTYRWNGTKFVQASGSTSFTTSTSHLSATMSDLVFGPASNGKHAGVMTVTLHNSGSHTINNASVVVNGGANGIVVDVVKPACTVPTYVGDVGAMVCTASSIKAGGTVTVTLHFVVPTNDETNVQQDPLLQEESAVVQVRVGDQALAKQPTLSKAYFN